MARDDRRVRIVFTRVPGWESVATIYRLDGVVVELPSFSRKHRVPHDLAHAVAERELGLARGIFGSLAAGALFSNVRVVSGRPRHDAAERSDRILRTNAMDLGRSELLGGALSQAVEAGRPADVCARVRDDWAVLHTDPWPYSDQQLFEAAMTLDRLGQAWQQLPAGEGMDFPWPRRLISSVPPGRAARRPARGWAAPAAARPRRSFRAYVRRRRHP